MNPGKSKYSVSAAILLTLFLAVPSLAEVLVICNKDVTESILTANDIEDIFLGRKTQWNNHEKITFVFLKEGEAHEQFLDKYIGKTAKQFQMYWKRKVFTGKGRMPKSFDSPEELRKYVAETAGAVGYLPAEAADDSIKILLKP